MADIPRTFDGGKNGQDTNACEQAAQRLVDDAIGLDQIARFLKPSVTGEPVGTSGIAKMFSDHQKLAGDCESMVQAANDYRTQMLLVNGKNITGAQQNEAYAAAMRDIGSVDHAYDGAEALLPGSGATLLSAANEETAKGEWKGLPVILGMDTMRNQSIIIAPTMWQGKETGRGKDVPESPRPDR